MAAVDDPRQWVTPEHLNVAPELLGLPLAGPKRRLAAMAIDAVVISLLVHLANFALVGGLALWATERAAAARNGAPWRRQRLAWGVAALLVALGGVQAWQQRNEVEPADAADDDIPHAVGLAAAAASGQDTTAALTARVKRLETELALARAAPATTQLRHWWHQAIEAIGWQYSWALLYFALLPAAWHGQTLGKRALGLRVVELTGKPMTVPLCFKRFGGYAAGMATGLLGFAQVLWDDNRQAIQDKTAHTVVVDLRRPRRAAPASDPITSSPAPTAPSRSLP